MRSSNWTNKRPRRPFDFPPETPHPHEAQVRGLVGADLKAAYAITAKGARHEAVGQAKAKVLQALAKSEANPAGFEPNKLGGAFKECEAEVGRRNILETGQ